MIHIDKNCKEHCSKMQQRFKGANVTKDIPVMAIIKNDALSHSAMLPTNADYFHFRHHSIPKP